MLLMLALQFIQARTAKGRPRNYRKSYLDLIRKIEHVTTRLNTLGQSVASIKNEKLLDYYESCLRLLENLLTMFQKIEPFGSDLKILNSAHYLTRDCNDRLQRTEDAFRSIQKGRHIAIEKVFGRKPQRVPIGCYFCSRPFLYAGFSKVKVRIEGEVKQVYSCDICKETLQGDKKVRVLYFLKDGKPVHWSEISDYNPMYDYWNINNTNMVIQSQKLELIRTQSDEGPNKS
jgi:hypothetical protein